MNSDPDEPEREPLVFPIPPFNANVPPDTLCLLDKIKQVAEKLLYHWKIFPIILPPPVTSNKITDSLNRKRNVCIKDLFVAPAFDELDVVAFDGKGDPRMLSKKQLSAIQDKGEFEVESINFPGQYHRWCLSHMLQKGRKVAHDSLLSDVALALEFILVIAKGRIVSHVFSVSHAMMSIAKGLLLLADVLIGVPSLQTKNLENKIWEERSKYLVAELISKPDSEEDMEALCNFVRDHIVRSSKEKFHINPESYPDIPYTFLTPKGQELDLRLFNRELMKKVAPIVAGILDKESRGWFMQFREKTIASLRAEHLTNEQIEKAANVAVMDEYLCRVYNNILTNENINICSADLGRLLVEHAKSVIFMQRSIDHVREDLKFTLNSLEKNLRVAHPILSRIAPWMKNQMKEAELKFIQSHKWTTHQESLTLCKEHSLLQSAYFLHRDLSFMKEREPVLTSELSGVRVPTRTFLWRNPIWLPQNWVVRKSFQGKSEVIPTVISSTPTSIVNPRTDPNEPVFLLEKEVQYSSSTRWFFWRWLNYLFRLWTWTSSAMFFFGIVVPLCSPVSLRALFCIDPFMPDYELSQVNGSLCPRKSSFTWTMISRLIALWRHISKSRTQFETMPDTGFIGKDFARQINRIWNYILKGVFGTLLLILVFPILCIVCSLSSLIVALSAPVWMPVIVLLFHLLMMLGYDFDSPYRQNFSPWFLVLQAIFWHIIILGICQPFLALGVAVIICPILSLMICVGAVIRRAVRELWDTFMFQAVIKRRGRVPVTDSFMAKRVSGPGMTSNFYYQISSEQAIAAFEAKLETEELQAFEKEMEQIIMKPKEEYKIFVETCFKPFSAGLVDDGVYKQLDKECEDLMHSLKEKTEKKIRELQCNLSVFIKSKVKMTSKDLRICLVYGTLLVEKFYPVRVLKRLKMAEKEFWEMKGLGNNDWSGLASIIMTEIFTPDILTPLEETDTRFSLQVNDVNLSKYKNIVESIQFSEEYETVDIVHVPKGGLQVNSPYLDISTFNPLSRPNANCRAFGTVRSWHPWKRKYTTYNADKLLIPLPIPHPATISIIIFNRDSDDPVPLDSTVCQELLHKLEGYHGTHNSSHRNSARFQRQSIILDPSNSTDNPPMEMGPYTKYLSLPSPPCATSFVAAAPAYGTLGNALSQNPPFHHIGDNTQFGSNTLPSSEQSVDDRRHSTLGSSYSTAV